MYKFSLIRRFENGKYRDGEPTTVGKYYECVNLPFTDANTGVQHVTTEKYVGGKCVEILIHVCSLYKMYMYMGKSLNEMVPPF